MRDRIARLTLVALVATSALSTDLYLSGIPQLAREFGTDEAAGQLTLSLFMFGFGSGQLVFGPLSDFYGRKPVVAAGIALYTLASLACALAASMHGLLAARLLQGIAASSGPVVARAIVRDRFHGTEAARVMSLLAAAMALMPLLAPVLGSWLLYAADWRAQFGLLALFGLATLLGLRALDESCPAIGQGGVHFTRVLGQFAACLANRRFSGFLLCGAALYMGMFAWISSTSWIVIDLLGVAPEHFGYTFMCAVAGYGGGSLLSTRLVMRLGLERMLGCGVALSGLGALGMAGCAAVATTALAPVLASVSLTFLGCGLCLPNAQMGAISEFPRAAGGASAVFGSLQVAGAALCGLAVGQFYDRSLWPTALALLLTTALAGCGLALLRATRSIDGGRDHG